jgi:exopolysaccharide biosynthesis polyprenyl glycosylphosphotransferase
MDRTEVTQQTSTTLPLRSELGHDAPWPRALAGGTFRGPLQWALEGSGWDLVRPTVDFAMLCLAVVLAFGGLSNTAHASGPAMALLLQPIVVLLLFYGRGLYKARLRAIALDALVPVISAVSVGAVGVATVGLLVNNQVPGHDRWAQAWIFSLLLVAGGRTVLSSLQRWARARRIVGKPVLILGAGVVGAQVARRLESHPEYGLTPIGFLDEDPRSVAEVGGRDVPVLGTPEDIDSTVARTGVKNLIVAFSSITDARVSRLIQHCQERGIEVSVVPRMFDTINNRVAYGTVGGLPLLSFTAVDPKGVQFAVKHAFDRVFAVLLLILLSPLLVCVAIAVRLTSPGPALFSQLRVGRDGKVFNFYKFRSMHLVPDDGEGQHGEDSTALDFLLGGDIAPGGVEGADRRTPIGRFLRRTSIDELPQLFNVLRGDMSIIGPRPERPEFVELFRNDIVRYGDRHRVKSGITGWAQVHGLRGQTSLLERVEWDNYYIAHWSLGLDLKVLVLTVRALFRNAE